ncbi:hypothetical protein [Pelagibacterium luteolum]|uniref:Uncharacterized protein n=1 Tax=Pelagibacterium luteolum TaxID=440168 RepID=A0A1G7TJB5_9HYPH|nr:hypothetical protein [Pelagibacterium luteolum]SDG35365.1 hypothetical protein SAMN04487974_102163 [Pelagibacterium luteolum]
MDARSFHNALRIMRNLEGFEMQDAGVLDENWGTREASSRDQLAAFYADPFGEALRMPDANFDRLYALIESRQPNRESAMEAVA